MKRPINIYTVLLILVLLNAGFANAQTEHERRIRIADLNDFRNYSFNRPNTELGTLVLDAAMNGMVQTYFFDDFNSEPHQLDSAEFFEKMSIQVEPWDYFEDWDPENSYSYDDFVWYKDKYYIAVNEVEVAGKEPGIEENSAFWERFGLEMYHGSEIARIELDEQFFNGHWNLQYIHFYTLGDYAYEGQTSYLFSTKSDEINNALNSSGIIWYKNYIPDSTYVNPLGHVIGNIFLLNGSYNNNRALSKSGIKLNDEIQLEIFDEWFGTYYPTFWTYKNLTPDSVFIYSDDSRLLDSLNATEINLQSGQIKLYGEAFATELITIVAEHELDPYLKYSESNQTKQKTPKLLSVQTRERIDLSHPSSTEFKNQANMFIREIIGKAEADSLNVYPRQELVFFDNAIGKLQQPFTLEILDEDWMYEESPDYYPSETYYQGDIVNFYGTEYYSLQDDNTENKPDLSPKYWQEYYMEAESVPAGDLLILDIDYKTTFTSKGKIKGKAPIRIDFMIPAELSYEGYDVSVGTINFEDLAALNSDAESAWKTVLDELRNQEKFRYQMIEHSPIIISN